MLNCQVKLRFSELGVLMIAKELMFYVLSEHFPPAMTNLGLGHDNLLSVTNPSTGVTVKGIINWSEEKHSLLEYD